MLLSDKLTISVAARSSPLSLAQIDEVLRELHRFHPYIDFDCQYVETQGDKDLSTSLRGLEKTDFFTREIDEMVAAGECRIAIHSAKDLPHRLQDGLTVAALTYGLDSSDALVFRNGDSLQTLKPESKVGTSSARRDEVIRALRPDLVLVDIRGNIGQRLAKLESGEIDALVTAEAALIRLQLQHLNRILLPGKTAEGQGKLAIVVKSDDGEMLSLFRCLDTRS